MNAMIFDGYAVANKSKLNMHMKANQKAVDNQTGMFVHITQTSIKYWQYDIYKPGGGAWINLPPEHTVKHYELTDFLNMMTGD